MTARACAADDIIAKYKVLRLDLRPAGGGHTWVQCLEFRDNLQKPNLKRHFKKRKKGKMLLSLALKLLEYA